MPFEEFCRIVQMNPVQSDISLPAMSLSITVWPEITPYISEVQTPWFVKWAQL